MDLKYSCVSPFGSGYWSVVLSGPSLWRGVASRSELESAFGVHDRLLMAGLFEWSNFSWQIFGEATHLAENLHSQGVGLAACCLENSDQLREIDAGCFREYMISNVEPVLFFFTSGRLRHTFRGPSSMKEFFSWMSSGGQEVADASSGQPA